MEVNDSPYVGLDPATSVGLGHLVRVASLRSILRVPSRILGAFDARLGRSGLAARRRLLRHRHRTPAVWVVDPEEQTVALRSVDVLRFSPGAVVVAAGIDPGETVVTAGVQALHPGQKVRLLEPAS